VCCVREREREREKREREREGEREKERETFTLLCVVYWNSYAVLEFVSLPPSNVSFPPSRSTGLPDDTRQRVGLPLKIVDETVSSSLLLL